MLDCIEAGFYTAFFSGAGRGGGGGVGTPRAPHLCMKP